METLLAILAGLILMSSLVKTGLLPIKVRLVVAVCYAVFIGCVTQRMTELSHEVFVQMTATRSILLDVAVCVILEAVVMMAYCFWSPKQNIWRVLLEYEPVLLAIPALSYFQAQLLYVLPGVDYGWVAWLSAGFVLFLMLGGSLLLRWLLRERHLLQELLFIINLMIVILCVAITGY